MVNNIPPGGNIFLTTENLAFSMPLILVCSTYAYFNFIPLHIGIPILAALVGIYLIRVRLQQRHAEKLQNLDEKTVMELVGDDSKDDDKENVKESSSDATTTKKSKFALARERKALAKKSGNTSTLKGGKKN